MLNPQVQSFFYYFLNDGVADEEDYNKNYNSGDYTALTEEYPKNILFLNIPDLNTFIQNSITKYYNIESNSEQLLLSDLTLEEDEEKRKPILMLKYNDFVG